MSGDLGKHYSVQAEKAQSGLHQIEEAILGLLQVFPDGLGNAEVAKELGLETSGASGQRNYLTWSVLQGMVARNILATIPRPKRTHQTLYVIKNE